MELVFKSNQSIKEALKVIDKIGAIGSVLFLVNKDSKLLGTLTDGDIRRGLLKDISIDAPAIEVANKKFTYVEDTDDITSVLKHCKKVGIRFLPLLNEYGHLQNVLDVNQFSSFLPVNAVIMAGGKGKRLMPLTANLPKPMLKVGEKPILEHNIDRLIKFGIQQISISINYLGHCISDYFQDGAEKGIQIDYLKEDKPLGTLGSITLKTDYSKEFILLMNSDLLTNIDFEDFFNEFAKQDADMAVAAVPYHSTIPYAVLDLNASNEIQSFKEKPRYTHYSNAGIYLFKKELLQFLKPNEYFDATDLLQLLIDKKKKIIAYPILGYWLDIGRMNDYAKAQEDIQHISL